MWTIAILLFFFEKTQRTFVFHFTGKVEVWLEPSWEEQQNERFIFSEHPRSSARYQVQAHQLEPIAPPPHLSASHMSWQRHELPRRCMCSSLPNHPWHKQGGLGNPVAHGLGCTKACLAAFHQSTRDNVLSAGAMQGKQSQARMVCQTCCEKGQSLIRCHIISGAWSHSGQASWCWKPRCVRRSAIQQQSRSASQWKNLTRWGGGNSSRLAFTRGIIPIRGTQRSRIGCSKYRSRSNAIVADQGPVSVVGHLKFTKNWILE